MSRCRAFRISDTQSRPVLRTKLANLAMWAGTRIRFRTRRHLCTFYEGRLSAFHQFFLASAEFFWGQLRNQYVFFRIRHYETICETAGRVQTLIAAPEY